MKHLLAAILIAFVFAAHAGADVIALHAAAEVEPGDQNITLGDIAVLEGDYAKSLADVKLTKIAEGQAETLLTAAGVRESLNEHEAHWGKLLMRGATHIRITRRAAGEPKLRDADPAAANAVPKLDKPDDAVSVPEALTLRRFLSDWLAQQLDANKDNIRIRFEKSQDDLLNQSLARYRFELEPVGRDLIGRVSINVRRYRANQLLDTQRLRVEVNVRRRIVVAARSLGRGQTLTAADVEVKTQWFDSMIKQPIGKVDQVVGQQTAGSLRTGDILFIDDVQAPVLVKRGQLVMVRCISGSLVLKTVARAREDGTLNQRITLRNERTRADYTARVSGPQEAIAAPDSMSVATAQPGGTR